jgi:hypothetical protein
LKALAAQNMCCWLKAVAVRKGCLLKAPAAQNMCRRLKAAAAQKVCLQPHYISARCTTVLNRPTIILEKLSGADLSPAQIA